jgi:hypothetical protein
MNVRAVYSKEVGTMSNRATALVLVFVTGLGVTAGCSKQSSEPAVVTLREFPIGGALDVLTQDSTAVDTAVTADGNGSLRVHAAGPATVRLYETGDLDVEDARIVYRAKLRTEGVQGKVYLEMWCTFAGKGEFFSRALQAPLSGTMDWTSQETPFFLKRGENPDNVKLNLVIEGPGTVWIDAITLTKGPLNDV